MQALLTLLVALFLAYLVLLICRSLAVASVSILAFSATLQIRNWYDPTIGYGLLLQAVSIKVLLCLIFLLHALRSDSFAKRWILISLGIFFWILSLLQYEIVLFLLPGILFLLISEPKRNDKLKTVLTACLTVPSLINLAFVQNLRSNVTPSAAYTINTEFTAFASTYIKQLSGVFPFSSSIFLDGYPDPQRFVGINFLTLAMVTAAIVITFLCLGAGPTSLTSFFRISLFGLVAVLFPPITTTVSMRWQSEISWGLPYLSVFIQYLGVSLLIVAIFQLFLYITGNWNMYMRYVLLSSLVFILLLATVVNHSAIKYVSDQIAPLKTERELYENAVRSGILQNSKGNAVFFSPNSDPNSWVNSYYTAWLGGPNSSSFVLPTKNLVEACSESTPNCDLSRQWIGLTIIRSNAKEEVFAIGELAKTNTEFSKTQLQTGSIKVATRKVVSLPSLCRKDIQIRKNVVFATCSKSVNNFSEIKD